MDKVVKSPGDCSEAELELFEKMVAEGGEVALAGIRKRIHHAERLVLINYGECVAVGAIKNPSSGYKVRVFEKSRAPESDKYKYELGWIYVSEVVRGKGYGSALMESIMHALSGEACFATTRENNASMHYLLNRFGFSKLGLPYESENGGYSLVLYGKL